MFEKSTVFILGAGASWHYGYPTGEGLVKKVIEKAKYASLYFEHSMNASNAIRPEYLMRNAKPDTPIREQWQTALSECNELKAGLEQVNPLVIDYYLGWNPRLQPIGKLLIAWVILECEQIRLDLGANVNRRDTFQSSPEREEGRYIDINNFKDDWCRFVIHELAINCKASSDLLRNNVRFITFNYDVSLEKALYQGLRHIQQFQTADVDKFFEDGRILHIYGKVRRVPPIEPPAIKWSEQSRDPKGLTEFALSNYYSDRKHFLDGIYNVSQNLRVIDPHDKETDKSIIADAKSAIADANRVYILGYGFDANNSERLGLPTSLHYEHNKKSVVFTNFRDINRVNKRASKVFFGNMNHFGPGGATVEGSRDAYYEKSVRDVYEAFELDFDALEKN